MPEFSADEGSVGVEGFGRFCGELHDCYSSPNIANIIGRRKIMRMWHVAAIW